MCITESPCCALETLLSQLCFNKYFKCKKYIYIYVVQNLEFYVDLKTGD